MFRIDAVEAKGNGVFATQPIPASTLILSEAPIVTIPKFSHQERYSTLVLPQLQNLSAVQKRNFFELNSNFQDMRPIESITKTNAIPLGSAASMGGVFLKCSRFNHSCTANAAYHWNEDVEEEKVYSVRDIDDGEEITVNYLSDEVWALPGRERRRQIQEAYGFDCVCSRCMNGQAFGEGESDVRRTRLGDIDRAIGGGELIMTNPAKALSMCREALELLHKEEEAAPRLESVYYDAFQICICHGDVVRGSTFAKLAVEAKRSWQGDRASGLAKMEAFVRNPASHGLAFHTKKWYSGSTRAAGRLGQKDGEWLWRRTG
ncbi:hypothetical protein M409DRAFT_71630 [Zasmidium cellare ATCC 36951]|uniref:SET domain-containing protein n=1 Tax=Zasmidium cellare ATCC 36951 TaxID=1080233 RepID=A0A6A6BUU9_ZASCE|nr:uncharacterized protein M409DRAFT_71630 [Zasmidium cellare ATCC 36951]KAF2158465.1 hypothetical protein M409DRAFT_71630 [Zasmidium cellare ATCC 36951]